MSAGPDAVGRGRQMPYIVVARVAGPGSRRAARSRLHALRGSWPPGCRPSWRNSTVFLDSFQNSGAKIPENLMCLLENELLPDFPGNRASLTPSEIDNVKTAKFAVPSGYYTRSELMRDHHWTYEMCRDTPHETGHRHGNTYNLYTEATVRSVEKQRAAQKATEAAQALRDAEVAAMCQRIAAQSQVADATPTNGGFKAKNAARAAGYLSESDMRRKPVAPKQDAVPIVLKGETFYGREQYEELVSRTAAKRRGLFVAENAEPVKELSQRGSFLYGVFRLTDCYASQTVEPISAGRRLLNLLRALPGSEKIAVTSRSAITEITKIYDTEGMRYMPRDVDFINQFDTQAPVTLVVRRRLPDTFVRDDGVAIPYMVVNGFRVVGDKIEVIASAEAGPLGDGVLFEEIEPTDARIMELAERQKEEKHQEFVKHLPPSLKLSIHPRDVSVRVGSVVDRVLRIIRSLPGEHATVTFSTGAKYLVRNRGYAERLDDQTEAFVDQFEPQGIATLTIRYALEDTGIRDFPYKVVCGLRIRFGEIEAIPADEMRERVSEEGVMLRDLTEDLA